MKTILLLFGGISDERYLSERSAKFIFNNINTKKWKIFPIKWEKNGKFLIYDGKFCDIVAVYNNFFEIINTINFDIIFNLLHGKDECNGILNGFLEFLKIPYIGNSMYTNFLCFNKFYTKLIFSFLKIRTPRFFLIKNNMPFCFKNLKFPIIIKPSLSGSSIGVKKINNEKEMIFWINQLFKREFDEIIIEEFIDGEEYSVCVIGDYRDKNKIILPVAKINYVGEIFDEKLKYECNYKVNIPSGLPQAMEKEIIKISLKLHNFLKATYITRTDLIVKSNKIYVLEVNSSPGLSSHSIISQILSFLSYNIEEIFEFLINQATLYKF